MFAVAKLTLAAAALLAVVAPLAQDPQPKAPAPAAPPAPAKPDAPAAQDSPFRQELSTIRRTLLAGGTPEAAAAAPRVRELGKQPLSTADRDAWVRVARDVALRLGDRPWLESLRDVQLAFGNELDRAVLLAEIQLLQANFAGARATLDRIGNVDAANEREKRRVFALRARLEQIAGTPAAERVEIERLVDHLYLWPRQRCQECHATMKQPDVVTTLPISTLWFGERYVALMRTQGDAEAVRAAAAAALAKDPQDDEERIRQAFALRALGREDEAIARFRELPWAAFPDRAEIKPRQFATYP